jgi:hypothetical protein
MLVRADHLLVQPYLVTFVQKVELYPLFPDRGIQLDGYGVFPEMYHSFPDSADRHKETPYYR